MTAKVCTTHHRTISHWKKKFWPNFCWQNTRNDTFFYRCFFANVVYWAYRKFIVSRWVIRFQNISILFCGKAFLIAPVVTVFWKVSTEQVWTLVRGWPTQTPRKERPDATDILTGSARRIICRREMAAGTVSVEQPGTSSTSLLA